MLYTSPRDPIAAVTHADPYPYYDRLVLESPVYWDEALHLWVVCTAQHVARIFDEPAARVRPPNEPVPRALAGTFAGTVFSQLVRMNDGGEHDWHRSEVHELLAAFADDRLEQHVAIANHELRTAGLDSFIERFPVFVLASALGFEAAELARAFLNARAFVHALAPNATGEMVVDGSAAAQSLCERLTPNALGLLFQSYDATRGLIGNTIAATGKDRGLCERVEQTIRFGSPVQNTRRFVAADFSVGNATFKGGQTILLLIAAANRDPAGDGRIFTFGTGAHACPGQLIATTVASAAVAHIIAQHPSEHDFRPAGYQPSANVRIPYFGETL